MSNTQISDNTQLTRPKRKLPKTAWKKGQPSPNPKGAPKRGESWMEIIKRVGDMTPAEAAASSLKLSKQLIEIGNDITLKEAVVLRVYGALLFDPNPGLLNAFMNRVEGMPKQSLEVIDWREQARRDGYDPERIFAKLVEAGHAAMDGASNSGSMEDNEANE